MTLKPLGSCRFYGWLFGPCCLESRQLRVEGVGFRLYGLGFRSPEFFKHASIQDAGSKSEDACSTAQQPPQINKHTCNQ